MFRNFIQNKTFYNNTRFLTEFIHFQWRWAREIPLKQIPPPYGKGHNHENTIVIKRAILNL